MTFLKVATALRLFVVLLCFSALPAEAALVEYDLDIDYKSVNYSGRSIRAMAIGGIRVRF